MSDLAVNEYRLKLTGTACMMNSLILGNSYDITIKNGEVRKSEDVPNDDGSKDTIFSFRISELSEVNIITDKGIILAKKRGSQARVLRSVIEANADEVGEDREEFYQRRMAELIDNEKNV